MKRRWRDSLISSEIKNSRLDFKEEVIKDLLYQIDYQTALRHRIVNLEEEVMIKELKKLPTGVLLSWYMAYLFIRSELMFAGYELNGLKVLNQTNDIINQIIKKDPYFDLNAYIF